MDRATERRFVHVENVGKEILKERGNILRVPGFFGPELAPPPDIDEQTRWLAFLGRAAWKPVTPRSKERIAT